MKKKIEQRIVVKVEGKIKRTKVIDKGHSVEILSILEIEEEESNPEPEPVDEKTVPVVSIEEISDEQRIADEAKKKELEEIKGTKEWLDKYFPIVKASSISLDDDWFKNHNPKSSKEAHFKHDLGNVLKSNSIKDFRAQALDPIIKDNSICYKKDMQFSKEMLSNSPNTWVNLAEKFLYEKNSRIGTYKERILFLGVIIKYLIEQKNYSIDYAWRAVCTNSKELGNYIDSPGSQGLIEPTGSRKIGDWYDFGNTMKLVLENNDRCSLIGGFYRNAGYYSTLVDKMIITDLDAKAFNYVGWVIMDV